VSTAEATIHHLLRNNETLNEIYFERLVLDRDVLGDGLSQVNTRVSVKLNDCLAETGVSLFECIQAEGPGAKLALSWCSAWRRPISPRCAGSRA
jgi:hypothetical protein